MKNIKLILEYDGTGFAGWQFQPDQRTLQGELEAAVKKISGEDLRVTASGRTERRGPRAGPGGEFQDRRGKWRRRHGSAR